MDRNLSPYEKNQLIRAGLAPAISSDDTRPVEYITQSVDFFGRKFYIDERALIPRLETELLVKKGLEELSKRGVSTPLHIADIGTGSGAIAISLCASFPSKVLEVTATDISSQAIEVAKYNAKKLLTPDQLSRCAFFVSDLFSEYETRKPIDILFANLPYIPTDRLSHLDASVIDNEPDVALDGGPQGASHIRKLLIEAPRFLAPKATVFLEVDHTHTTEDLFKDPSKYEISFFKDDGGYRRFVHATYLG